MHIADSPASLPGPAHYSNPVLNADWPDPDVIEVDGTYYLVASSFSRVPGLPILKSHNLVDWEHVGHALERLHPHGHFSQVRPGSGVWAPSLRYHNGRFWIFYPDPDQGIFVVSAECAEGPWSPPHLLYAGKGIIDPCPLWDDDGRAYLVHGWAFSRSGIRNRLTVHEMAPDATHLLDDGRTVINGDALPGYTTLEGPKFYKHGGWYWIFAPAGGVAEGWQSVFRSASVFGPYEDRIVLEQGNSPVNGPHQGAWVRTPAGEDWFLHFQDRGAYGRVVHLQPMTWSSGWPVIGRPSPGADIGTPVSEHPYPAGTHPLPVSPPGSDDFLSRELGRQWHWQANPTPKWLTLPGDGTAILHPVPGNADDLRTVPNVLGQVLPGIPSVFTTTVGVGDVPVGTRAGVVVLGLHYAWLGVIRTEAGYFVDGGVDGVPAGDTAASGLQPLTTPSIDIRVVTDTDDRASFSWRTAGEHAAAAAGQQPWLNVPWTFSLSKGHWVGAELGVFAVSPPDALPRTEGPQGGVIVGPVRLEPATVKSNSPIAAAP